MRAIDADALIEFIENRYEITWESDSYEGGIKDACSDILEKIDAMPTIEPERKVGKWIKPIVDGRAVLTTMCSECGYINNSSGEWNYCPKCGIRIVMEEIETWNRRAGEQG